MILISLFHFANSISTSTTKCLTLKKYYNHVTGSAISIYKIFKAEKMKTKNKKNEPRWTCTLLPVFSHSCLHGGYIIEKIHLKQLRGK